VTVVWLDFSNGVAETAALRLRRWRVVND